MPNNRYFHLYAVLGLFCLTLVAVRLDYLTILIVYMMIVPMFDRAWRDISEGHTIYRYAYHARLVCAISIVLLIGPDFNMWLFAISTICLAALPEEFFFRRYLQSKLGNSYVSILSVSAIFSILHMITVSWVMGLLVFIPSIIYGYIFKKTGDLILIILVHGLSNVVYKLYISESINSYVSF